MRIILTIPSLTMHGGIERLACWLASSLVEHGHTVFLFTTDKIASTSTYFVHNNVRVVHHDYKGDERQLAAFRERILDCSPDVCVSLASWRFHLGWCAALWQTGIPWIYSEHGTPEIIESEIWNRPERLAAMTAADYIHLLRASCADTLPADLQSRVRIVPNPCFLERTARPVQMAERKIILSLGRLDADKQTALIVEAFTLLHGDFPQWDMEIWGNGPEQKNLHTLIGKHSLHERIHLRGATHNPAAQYARAALFAMPSRHECFPLTVVESLHSGLPVVAFADCQGVCELVQHGTTGMLAESMTVEALTMALRTLMENDKLRERMAQNAPQSVTKFFPEYIYHAWESLLVEASACKGKTRLRDPDPTTPTTEQERYALLKRCIARPHVHLNDRDVLRLFFSRHPRLRTIQHFVRKFLRLMP